jgi:hypothetical protein
MHKTTDISPPGRVADRNNRRRYGIDAGALSNRTGGWAFQPVPVGTLPGRCLLVAAIDRVAYTNSVFTSNIATNDTQFGDRCNDFLTPSDAIGAGGSIGVLSCYG